MIINDRGRQIIMDSEGRRLKAYLCPAGRWTIGWGHTGDVKKGDVITPHQAEVIFEYDLKRFEEGVEKLVPKGTNENQFSALVSFAFNFGLEKLRTSILLKHLNAGAPHAAAHQFDRWIHAEDPKTKKMVVLPGLVKRRAEEKALFLTPVLTC